MFELDLFTEHTKNSAMMEQMTYSETDQKQLKRLASLKETQYQSSDD
jgi:hypothetical protein